MRLLDLDENERKAFVKRTIAPERPKSVERRTSLADRIECLEERPEVVARKRIRKISKDQKVAAHICEFASNVFNPLLNISTRIAQGYAHPPIRRIPGKADAEAQLLKFLEGPTRFDSRARSWNLKSVALSCVVVLVVPRKRRGKPCFDFRVVTGATAEVMQDPTAPFGDTPGMLAYCIGGKEAVCVVDDVAYYYCDASGKVLREETHGLDRFPGAVLRSAEPDGSDDDDWWHHRHNSALLAGTAIHGTIAAICEWARKSQFGPLLAITREPGAEMAGEPEAEEGQTVGTPESVLDVEAAKVEALNFEAKIDGFLKHLASVLHETSRRTTGSSRALDDQLLTPEELAQRHAVLLGLQRDQHGFLVPFEREILEIMAAMGEALGIPDFPKVSEIEEYEAVFTPLTFIATPEARLDYFVAATKFGVSDQVQFLQEQGWSEADAIELLERIAKRRAQLHDIQASRNSPADPTDAIDIIDAAADPSQPGERPEALTGRVGGTASGEARTSTT